MNCSLQDCYLTDIFMCLLTKLFYLFLYFLPIKQKAHVKQRKLVKRSCSNKIIFEELHAESGVMQ